MVNNGRLKGWCSKGREREVQDWLWKVIRV